jgi:hypothetical protein
VKRSQLYVFISFGEQVDSKVPTLTDNALRVQSETPEVRVQTVWSCYNTTQFLVSGELLKDVKLVRVTREVLL